jgi:hypothetical protein|uniref:Uncharacterized protein n=1 Tax=Bionectria ochroleuca TaxID=29856 RepID=A0A8H7K6U0_BIOOC
MASGACLDSSRIGEEEEVAREHLAYALEQFERSVSFATFEALGDVLPVKMGLTVFGLGDLDMPLNEGDLRQVIALFRPRYGNSRQARLGKCNTWELDPEQLAFSTRSGKTLSQNWFTLWRKGS